MKPAEIAPVKIEKMDAQEYKEITPKQRSDMGQMSPKPVLSARELSKDVNQEFREPLPDLAPESGEGNRSSVANQPREISGPIEGEPQV